MKTTRRKFLEVAGWLAAGVIFGIKPEMQGDAESTDNSEYTWAVSDPGPEQWKIVTIYDGFIDYNGDRKTFSITALLTDSGEILMPQAFVDGEPRDDIDIEVLSSRNREFLLYCDSVVSQFAL